MTSKINAEWHNANRMPKNPTHDQRMQWHFEHSKNCHCYPMTAKIEQELADWRAARTVPSQEAST